jgi:hypothetical protein
VECVVVRAGVKYSVRTKWTLPRLRALKREFITVAQKSSLSKESGASLFLQMLEQREARD